MNYTKYKLDSRRFRVRLCPCGKSNKDGKFVPYVGFENKGYCHACGETFLPEPEITYQPRVRIGKSPKAAPSKPVSFIPVPTFTGSLKAYEGNHFVQYLVSLFGEELATQLVSEYFIGSSKHWQGSTVFWQIDIQGRVRTGKIMLYNPVTGKRVKEPYNHIHWAHSALNSAEFALKQCFFGEHLLKEKTKPVAIVEAEKTATIAKGYLPRFTWLAVGGIEQLTAEKCHVLKGRKVFLFPDLNAFEKWQAKAQELSRIANFTVSTLLEEKATNAERISGLDLADYLVRFDISEFKQPEVAPLPAEHEHTVGTENFFVKSESLTLQNFEPTYEPAFEPLPREDWEQEIAELEQHFSRISLPVQPVKLNNFSTVTNVSLFVSTHIATLRANNGNRTFVAHLNRLNQLAKILN